MAATRGESAATLAETLEREPFRFDFFQAVRLFQIMGSDRSAVGEDADPADETVRMRSDVSLAFPASDLRGAALDPEGVAAPRLTVNFFGVATPGSFGSLPICYAEQILSSERDGDSALRDFLDLFNHRLLSLLYRAWEKHRWEVGWERSEAAGGGLFENASLAIIGMRTDGLRHRLPFPDQALLGFSAALTRRPVAAESLERIVADFFGVPVRIEQFVPGWYLLADEDRLRVGSGTLGLGRDTFLGRSVRVAQFKFQLVVGPLDRETYREFLPDGTAFRDLRELVRFAVGMEFDFEIRLILRGRDVPELRLWKREGSEIRLGWNSWLATRPLDRDPSDVVVSGDARAPHSVRTGSPVR